jgi:hypothetical protein
MVSANRHDYKFLMHSKSQYKYIMLHYITNLDNIQKNQGK